MGVCSSATGWCWKGALLECLLAFSSVSVTHRSRMFTHQAAPCSRGVATSSARIDSSSRWLLGMSLPGVTSREYRMCSSMLKAQELPEPCQELVTEFRAWAAPCQALTDGCALSFPSASSPGPLPLSNAWTWLGW